MISYDAEKAPELPLELLHNARVMGLHVFHIHLRRTKREGRALRGRLFLDRRGVPSPQGDLFNLEDGTVCKVKAVTFKVGRIAVRVKKRRKA